VRARFAAACFLALALAGCGGADEPTAAAASDSKLAPLELIGKRVFFDQTLSNPPGQSCGSCHEPATGFSGNFGGVAGVPLAADGLTPGLRNTPTASYARFTPPFTLTTVGTHQVAMGGQFLDGRAASLEEQAGMPFFSAGEMNIASVAQLSERLAAAPYAALIREEFGADVFSSPQLVLQAVTRAIAAFERTEEFAPFSSKLDHALAGEVALSHPEQEGLRLFLDPLKGNCTACHAFKPESDVASERVFTDFSYHALGVPRNDRIPANADPAFFDLGLCGPRRARVADDALCGAFKVPTLRNVARKTAFMHNGVFADLREAVAFHAFRGDRPIDDLPAAFRGNVAGAIVPPGMQDREIDAITAFLRTLDDGFSASLSSAAR
jgi:cytochrome c peroxidase